VRFLSVCSGIEAASVAWSPLGFEAVAFAEVEQFPSAVLAHHYPTVPNWGDIEKFNDWPHPDIDVLVGGTPCQSFSVAGRRKGLADLRGNLALVYLAIAERYRPEWVVWENVPGVLSSGGGRDFGAFLGGLAQLGYGFAYAILDARYFGVPQRRRRVFVVGHFGDWRRAAAVLFERASLSGDSPPGREAGESVALPVTSRVDRGGEHREAHGNNLIANSLGAKKDGGWRGDLDNDTFIAHSLRAQSQPSHRADSDTFVAHCLNGHGGRIDAESETFIAQPLRGFDGVHPPLNTVNSQQILRERSTVRRLTPRECERLQGFPDDYTLIPYRGRLAADGPRYKALGNSMAVPVMRWIGARLKNGLEKSP
jgi:DNA (cytosine-5)-methyltransferase 1